MSGDDAAAVFGALGDPTRRRLLSAIADRPSLTATELASALPISRQAVLKHLNALSDAGLLQRERAGREVHYSVTPEPLSDAVSWMADVGGQWDQRLAALASALGDRPRGIASPGSGGAGARRSGGAAAPGRGGAAAPPSGSTQRGEIPR
jgi:DNA-binding transcriptional ArsR family regulator